MMDWILLSSNKTNRIGMMINPHLNQLPNPKQLLLQNLNHSPNQNHNLNQNPNPIPTLLPCVPNPRHPCRCDKSTGRRSAVAA